MRTRLAVLFLAALAATELSGQAKPDTIIVRMDSLRLRQLAAEKGVDTAKARLRIVGDSAWVWFRRDANYSSGVQFVRAAGRWEVYKSEDTTTAVAPPPMRVPRAPVPRGRQSF